MARLLLAKMVPVVANTYHLLKPHEAPGGSPKVFLIKDEYCRQQRNGALIWFLFQEFLWVQSHTVSGSMGVKRSV